MKVLIVEDELELQNVLVESLTREKYVIETASNFKEASEKFALYEYDCILLDISLPDGNGLNLLEQLKGQGKSGSVLILSAKDSLDDKLAGLDLGADDYLTKPFHMTELHARIKAVLRRQKMDGKNTVDFGNISLDFVNRTVHVHSQELAINRKEFDVLNYFLMNKERLVTKSALAEHVWGDKFDQADNFDFIYYQVKNLRKKLHDAKATVEIDAVYGIGYKLIEK